MYPSPPPVVRISYSAIRRGARKRRARTFRREEYIPFSSYFRGPANGYIRRMPPIRMFPLLLHVSFRLGLFPSICIGIFCAPGGTKCYESPTRPAMIY